MARINRTNAEYAKARGMARKASTDQRAHYAVPGVWEAEKAQLEKLIKSGTEQEACIAKNSLIVLQMYKPIKVGA